MEFKANVMFSVGAGESTRGPLLRSYNLELILYSR